MQPTVGVDAPGDMVVFGSESPYDGDPMVRAFDPESGETQWTATGPGEPSSPVAADDDYAYIFSKTGTVFALDHQTGDHVWEASIPRVNLADLGVVQFAPVLVDDLVAVPVSGTEDDVVDRVVGFTRSEGTETFSTELPASIAGAPASDPSGVIVPLLDGTLLRVDTDGAETWNIDLGGPMSDISVANGTAYVGCATESVFAIDIETGELRWESEIENTVMTRPLVADGRVFVGGIDYYLYAFDVASGERLWRTETPNAITSGPTMVDGKLVTLSGGNRRPRGPTGTVPFSPTVFSVHDVDGTRTNDYRFEGYLDGGQPKWAAAVGDNIYIGQEWQLAQITTEVLDAE